MRVRRRLSLCGVGAVEKDRTYSRCLAQRVIRDFAACLVLLVRQLSPVRSRVGEQRCTEAVSAPIRSMKSRTMRQWDRRQWAVGRGGLKGCGAVDIGRLRVRGEG